jgi:NAD(P)-dependent dehydrogenase (short-subunit alcohol dehydrogenase family)
MDAQAMDFSDRVALVTGGGSGLGRAACESFARAGAAVVVVDIDPQGAEETAALVESRGGRAQALACDVSDHAAVAATVKEAVKKFGRLDMAFNNAAVCYLRKPLADVTIEDWDTMIAVTLSGVFYCMKYEIPELRKVGGGSIVNTSAIGGLMAFGGFQGYIAAKHGVVGLTKTAALDHAGEGIRVNAVCPGSIRTPLMGYMMQESPVQDESAFNPVGRAGEPAEVGDLAVWLCSPQAAFITGTAIPVDGGLMAGIKM